MSKNRGVFSIDKDGGIDLHFGKVRLTIHKQTPFGVSTYSNEGYMRWYMGYFEGGMWHKDVLGVPSPNELRMLSFEGRAIFVMLMNIIQNGTFLGFNECPIAEIHFTKSPAKISQPFGSLSEGEFSKPCVEALAINHPETISACNIRIKIEYL